MSANIARSLGNRWLEMEPEDLVESTLVSGALVLENFDEGLDILCEAEDNAALNISGKAYSALMRLAQSEERPVEALQLLARTRAYAVDRTDGLLVSAMRAAAALDDWGAVARLYAELRDGEEAAAQAAMELETIADDASVLNALGGGAGDADVAPDAPAEREMAEALRLALQAHCERGDVRRVRALLAAKRAQQDPLLPEEYVRLWHLARRTKAPPSELLSALRIEDLVASLQLQIEPRLLAAQNKLGVVAASLGRVERVVAAGLALSVVLVVLASLFGAGAPDAVPADVFARDSPSDSIDTLTAVPGLYP